MNKIVRTKDIPNGYVDHHNKHPHEIVTKISEDVYWKYDRRFPWTFSDSKQLYIEGKLYPASIYGREDFSDNVVGIMVVHNNYTGEREFFTFGDFEAFEREFSNMFRGDNS